MKPYPDMNKESNEHLPSAKFPVPLLVLMETDSTNRHLTQLCDEQGTDIPEFMTVIAERQSRRKRATWQQLGIGRLQEHYIQLRTLSYLH